MEVQILSNLREFRPLQAPFIKVETEVVLNGITNGKNNLEIEVI